MTSPGGLRISAAPSIRSRQTCHGVRASSASATRTGSSSRSPPSAPRAELRCTRTRQIPHRLAGDSSLTPFLLWLRLRSPSREETLDPLDEGDRRGRLRQDLVEPDATKTVNLVFADHAAERD